MADGVCVDAHQVNIVTSQCLIISHLLFKKSLEEEEEEELQRPRASAGLVRAKVTKIGRAHV